MRAFHIAEREARLRYDRSHEATDYFGETVDRMLEYEHEMKGGLPPRNTGINK
jgi:hypothetical protein